MQSLQAFFLNRKFSKKVTKFKQVKTIYKKFHDLKLSHRISILLYLCQNKLDTEVPEFM